MDSDSNKAPEIDAIDNVDEDGPSSVKSLSITLSEEIKAFMRENNIPADAYEVKTLSRFIRINPSKPITFTELQEQLQANPPPEAVPWLPSFYRLDRSVGVAGCKAYKEGRIYGIDACSGAVVRALDARPGHHVLDLCCAPGSKLCMLGDEINHTGSLTGVDVIKERLSACKTLLRKYSKQNTRLFLTDGSKFSILAPGSGTRAELPPLPDEEVEPPLKKARRRRKGKEKDADGLYYCNTFPLRSADCDLYDRVLVDAECSGDASIRHILLFGKSSPVSTPQLTQLQKKLIFNGFRLLKPGGVLVYSTCSFCTSQNEDIVQYLLDACPTAKLLPIHLTEQGASSSDSNSVVVPWDKGYLEHTVRFYPKSSMTSGMFIAKITKIVQ